MNNPTIVRFAYLYARNNGCSDAEGAEFADWFIGSGFNSTVFLAPEFNRWLDRRLTETAEAK